MTNQLSGRRGLPTFAGTTYAWKAIFYLSGRRGSNSPPIAWKAIALPNELLPLINLQFAKSNSQEPKNSGLSIAYCQLTMWAEKDSNLRTRERTDLQSVAFSHSAICPTCSY
jgi:hypothetical protein